MKRYLLNVAYNGTNYSGWQSQNNAVTIQDEIEKCIEKITSIKVNLFASGRTDAGVHAENQTVHFDIDKDLNMLSFKKSLNAVLPDDIVVKNIKEVSLDFHARFNVKKKIYSYHINLGDRDVFNEKTELHFPHKINLKNMKKASKYLVGHHDFSSFCASKTSVTDFERTIYFIKFYKHNDKLIIQFCGNGFLYNMVRIIVGTLLEVGQGKRQPKDIKTVLEMKDRKLAGKTAEAKGLFLTSVEY